MTGLMPEAGGDRSRGLMPEGVGYVPGLISEGDRSKV